MKKFRTRNLTAIIPIDYKFEVQCISFKVLPELLDALDRYAEIEGDSRALTLNKILADQFGIDLDDLSP